MFNMKRNRQGQEEMVGFALIIIVVFVVLLFLFVFSLKDKNKSGVESYEVESFLQATLQQTTNCTQNSRIQSVQDLVLGCMQQEVCDSGTSGCEVLNSTLIQVSDMAWPYGAERPVKGYSLIVASGGGDVVNISRGNVTEEYKGAVQSLPGAVNVSFKAYYSG